MLKLTVSAANAKAVRDIIERVRTIVNGNRRSAVGLCDNIEYSETYGRITSSANEVWCEVKHQLFKSWPEYSGDSGFPVPHDVLSPSGAYIEEADLYAGEYGESRIRLAEHIVCELTEWVLFADSVMRAETKLKHAPYENVTYALNRLRSIKDGNRSDSVGICAQVGMGFLRALFARWPEFSGDLSFPVPCPDGGSPDAAFLDQENLYSGEYGASRLRLVQFCIDELTEELAAREVHHGKE